MSSQLLHRGRVRFPEAWARRMRRGRGARCRISAMSRSGAVRRAGGSPATHASPKPLAQRGEHRAELGGPGQARCLPSSRRWRPGRSRERHGFGRTWHPTDRSWRGPWPLIVSLSARDGHLRPLPGPAARDRGARCPRACYTGNRVLFMMIDAGFRKDHPSLRPCGSSSRAGFRLSRREYPERGGGCGGPALPRHRDLGGGRRP